MVKLALAALLASCSYYDPGFRDCEIRCNGETSCPDGFQCGPENLCRLDGETQTCTEVLGDAGLGDAGLNDSPSDGMPPIDAFACSTHAQCNAMMPGNCCVNPGPTGYCTHGTVIGGNCVPQ